MNTLNPSTHNQDGRFHTLLDENRDMVLVFLSAQLNDLFGSTDEALLDFAEHSENNSMQSRFFEAMGAVRKYRSEIEHVFREEVHDGFEHFFDPPGPTEEKDIPLGELALIRREDMDESVAVENLIGQCRNNYFMQLHALGQRLAVLNHGNKVPESDIPGGPTHLVHSFRISIHTLQIDTKAKIVLYALFDKFVMRHLKGLYDEFNGSLKNAGVLPNLKPTFIRSDSQSAGPRREEKREQTQDFANEEGDAGLESGADSGARMPLGEELFGSILQLLATRHRAAASGASPGTPTPAGEGAGAPQGQPGALPTMSAEEARGQLMSTLDTIRPRGVGEGRGVLSDLEALPKVAADPNFLESLKAVIADERQEIYSQLPAEQMQGIDADTIELIGMLFEYMLNDPLLPNLAKALLSHLHTPYLKLSLTDATLLADSEHPARLLLDLLVEAGGQWVYENDINRGIFPKMQIVVDRVLKELSKNEELLSELLEYFMAETDAYRRKSDAIEQRAQESVKGREKLQVAKQRAAQEIQGRTEHLTLPRSVEKFLSQAWTDRLVFILLRQEEAELSEEWNRALQTADELVWLFGPEAAETEEREFRQVSSAVQEEIEKALESLGGYHERYLNKLFELLGNPSAVAHWHERRTETPYSEPLMPDSESLFEPSMPTSAMFDEPSGRPPQEPPPEPFSRPPAPEETTAASQKSLSEPEQEMLDKLQRQQFGTWFEFRDKGDKTRRLKLSWLSPLTATCMFVDKNGAQAQIKTLDDTARMMVAGEAKIIPRPKQQFVERAMLAIKGTLQRSMQAAD